MSHTVTDTPRPFQPPITQRDVELEVANCVGGEGSAQCGNNTALPGLVV
jgi:hypothetical protein